MTFRKLERLIDFRFVHVCVQSAWNFVYRIWGVLEKIKTHVVRLHLVSKLKKFNFSKTDRNMDVSDMWFWSRSCIGFLGNRSGGPRTGQRARPQVADRGSLYRGLLLNTNAKLNKQSRTMFQRPPRVFRPYPGMRGSGLDGEGACAVWKREVPG